MDERASCGGLIRGKVQINLDPESSIPFYLQISVHVSDAIRKGVLAPGEALPGSRELSECLGVSRSTVQNAMDDLREQGWVDTLPRIGVVVSPQLHGPKAEAGLTAERQETIAPGFDLPTRPDLNTSRIGRLVKFSSSLPDSRLLSLPLLGRAYHKASRVESVDSNPAFGHYDLRSVLAIYLGERRGMLAFPESILVTSGNRMALNLLAWGLLGPGDLVAVEDPGDYLAWECLRQTGAGLMGIPVDGQGLDVDALERRLSTATIRLLYLTPRFQVPSTVSLAPERRKRLLQLAHLHGFLIIEEDSEAEYTFEGRALLPLAAEEGADCLIHLYSFARLMAPGIRLGFLSAPPAITERLSQVGRKMGWCTDVVLERAMTELFLDREIHRHIQRVRKVYRERRDALIHHVRDRFDGLLEIRPPCGGLSAWVAAEPELDLEGWCQRCAVQGIALLPGARYSLEHPHPPGFRIGFASLTPDEMADVLDRMKAALHS